MKVAGGRIKRSGGHHVTTEARLSVLGRALEDVT